MKAVHLRSGCVVECPKGPRPVFEAVVALEAPSLRGEGCPSGQAAHAGWYVAGFDAANRGGTSSC